MVSQSILDEIAARVRRLSRAQQEQALAYVHILEQPTREGQTSRGRAGRQNSPRRSLGIVVDQSKRATTSVCYQGAVAPPLFTSMDSGFRGIDGG